MKKFLEKVLAPMENGFAAPLKDKSMNFINKHPEMFCLLLLALACFIFLFVGLNFYPLMDVDETRYAIIARDLFNTLDWNSLNLNMAPFMEKPPLYFWLVGASIKFFGGLSGFAVRLPIAVLATFITFFTYYVGKRVISRKFGMISALILLSSVFFLILSHIAILDMVLTVFMTSAIYCAFLTHFCKDKNKKYFWWYFYLFMGLGFLAKGILGLVLPALIIFTYNLITKTAKDIFKPINMLPGIIIFLLIIIPWHLVMYLEYGTQFFREYFLVHHFARFMNSVSIGRERPFLYFVPVFFLGFFPWSFIFIAFLYDGFKKMAAKYKSTEGKIKEKICALFETSTNEQKLLVFSSIYFIIVFLVFSVSSTKLPTYILPIFPAAALLTGYYWWVSDEKCENEKGISVVTQIFAALFMFVALVASIGYFVLPIDIQSRIEDFQQITIIAIYMLCIFLLLRLNTKRALSIFSGYVFIMIFIIMLSVSQLFNLVYSTGENEIVQYSKLAQSYKSPLVTFDFAVKPSAMIDYAGYVRYVTDPDFNQLDEILKSSTKPTFVIIKNKNMRNDAEYSKKVRDRLQIIQFGEKYSLYIKDVNNKYKKISRIYYNQDLMAPIKN